MNCSKTSMLDKDRYAIEQAWGQYRVYAKTSRKRKQEITNWRLRVLILGIIGAALGMLCQESIRLELDTSIWQHLPKLLGGLSALILGLATYFGKELVGSEQERQWIRSRSMAEAIKAQSYLFLTSVPPYDEDNNAQQLIDETERLLESVNDLPHLRLSEEEKRENLPLDMLTVEKYIEARVRDQIDNFYYDRVDLYTQKMKNIRTIGLVLGIMAIAFGALGTTGWTAGWVAVIGTASASITAYAYANRYQYLVISYQSTAKRLELLLNRWEISQKTDKDTEERKQFIRDCEEAISIENSSWMAELARKAPLKAKIGGSTG